MRTVRVSIAHSFAILAATFITNVFMFVHFLITVYNVTSHVKHGIIVFIKTYFK